MKSLPQDTSPEAAREVIRIARGMTPEAKFLQVSRLIEATREMAMAGLRTRHPDASEAELHRRYAALVLGPDTAQQVYGPLCEHEK